MIDELLDGIEAHTTGTLAEQIRKLLAGWDPAAVRKTREQKLAARKVTRRDGPAGITTLPLSSVTSALTRIRTTSPTLL